MARVLIVDDDPGIREAVRWLLEDDGYDVEEAQGGEQALAMLRASTDPLVILLDYRMPGAMSGGDVLRVAIAEGLVRRHAFVLIPATPDLFSLDLQDYAKALGIPVIAKPFDIDTLLATVASRAAQLDAA